VASDPDATTSVAAIDALDPAACRLALAPLFEGAPGFLARLVAARPFGSPEVLFQRARAIAHAMPEPEQVELIDAHPRLGAPLETLSAASFAEQGYVREASPPPRRQIDARLAGLNAAYEARFGFRYCVFVAGRPRAALLPDMEAALDAGRDDEIRRAIDAVIDIAADRYRTRTVI
jgi:2-oxo-4-hydroxy-4-carboxy--5-ureidoimidazoline (OHCU) decarboxylase